MRMASSSSSGRAAAAAAAANLQLPLEVTDIFLTYSVLRLERFEYSHELLVRASKIAAPIARKRGWRVGRLKEFQPKNNSLYGLNVNRGQEVCIRTRSADGGFLEFEAVLKTLLHELVHNVHGNHSATFYEMLDELEKEAESVLFRAQHGISDPNRYWGSGQRLGHGPQSSSSRPPFFPTVRTIQRGPGNQLGGSKTPAGLSARDAAVRAALARRRIDDGHSCGTQQSQDDAEDEDGNIIVVSPTLVARSSKTNASAATPPSVSASSSSQAAKAPDVIVLIDDDEGDKRPSTSPAVKDQPPINVADKRTGAVLIASETKPLTIIIDDDDEGDAVEGPNDNGDEHKEWTCPKCTSRNEPESLLCMECLSVRPNRWQCPRCSYVNVRNHLQCLACHTIQPPPA